MVLKLGSKNIFEQEIFKNSPNDDDTLIFQGNKEIPSSSTGGQKAKQTKNPETMGTDDTVGTNEWGDTSNATESNNAYARSELLEGGP